MHELTRVRAYARLIIAIAGDDTASYDAQSRAITALADRFVDTAPSDHVCVAPSRPMMWCEGCASR